MTGRVVCLERVGTRTFDLRFLDARTVPISEVDVALEIALHVFEVDCFLYEIRASIKKLLRVWRRVHYNRMALAKAVVVRTNEVPEESTIWRCLERYDKEATEFLELLDRVKSLGNIYRSIGSWGVPIVDRSREIRRLAARVKRAIRKMRRARADFAQVAGL